VSKIIYVGELGFGSTSLMRMKCIEELGYIVYPIDTTLINTNKNILKKNISRLYWRLGYPLDLSSINLNLKLAIDQFKPDLVWVDKGIYVTKDTILNANKKNKNIKWVHFNPDDPFGKHGTSGWKRFINAIPYYDLHFVPRLENVSEYYKVGAKKVVQNMPMWGYDPKIHKPFNPNPLQSAFGCDVGFLGAYEEERAESLFKIANQNINIRLMSTWPKKYLHKNFLLSPYPVEEQKYGMALSTFKIGIGFLRKANRDRHTSRSIEIPACGTFLLAERTEEHLQLFKEGSEAEYFSNDEELVDKIKFYLKHNELRNKIAEAGMLRCMKSKYDNKNLISKMLKVAFNA